MIKIRVSISALIAAPLVACVPSGPPIHVDAPELYGAFLSDAVAAGQKYNHHTLIVDGLSGGVDNEASGYVLTLVPGVRVHLGSDTSGAPLFKQVSVQCSKIKFASAVLELDGCTVLANSNPPKAAAIDVSAVTNALPTTSEQVPDRLSAAFEAATGRQNAFDAEEESGTFTVRPLTLVNLPVGVVLLTERRMKDGCHACVGALGVSYLSERNGKFQILKNWPRAIEGAGFGSPPNWHVTNEFTRYPAVYSETSYMYQGDSGTTASLTELQPTGPVTSEPISVSGSNEGVIEDNQIACVYNGSIVNIRNDRSFDVKFTGSISGRDHYIKRGNKFVVVSNAMKTPQCKFEG